MIGSLKRNNNFYPILLNRVSFDIQKPQNLRSNYKDTFSFSGRNFVRQRLFGQRILIPKAVEDAKQSTKRVVEVLNGNAIKNGNCVCLKNNIFLSVAHCYEEVSDYMGIGRFLFRKNIYNVDTVDKTKLNINHSLDLSKLQLKSSKIKWAFSQSKPIKIAKSMPTKGERVYIIGQNSLMERPKAIPANFFGYVGKQQAIDSAFGQEANYCYIFSPILNKNAYRFSATGLSGAPVVNNKGELIGIHVMGDTEDKGHLMIIGLDDIKTFLSQKSHKVKN